MLLLPVTMLVMGIVVLVPVLPAMAEHFQALSNVDVRVGVLLTMPALMVVLFAAAAGLLADLLGRRRILLIAMVAYAAAGVLPFFLQDFWPILASRVVVGLCEAVVVVTSTTMIGDYFEGAERDKWLSYQVAVASVAATALILAGGVLGGIFGWQGPFLVYALALPLAAGVALLLWEVKPDPAKGEQAGSASGAGFPGARMAGMCAITLFGSFLFYLVQVELSFGLARLGVTDPQRAGMMISLSSIGVVVGAVVFKSVSSQPVARLLTGEFLLAGASLVAMGYAASYQSLVAWAFVNQIGSAMILSTLLTWAVRSLPFEHRGRGTGIWQGTFSLGQFLVSVSIPVLNVLTGSLPASFVAIGLVAAGAAAAACVVALRRSSPAAAAVGCWTRGLAVLRAGVAAFSLGHRFPPSTPRRNPVLNTCPRLLSGSCLSRPATPCGRPLRRLG